MPEPLMTMELARKGTWQEKDGALGLSTLACIYSLMLLEVAIKYFLF
jgi:hypothetical protein